MLERLLLVGAGAFVGAICRYLVGLWVTEHIGGFYLFGWVTSRLGASFPYGTLLVNVSGSFLLAFLFVLTTDRLALNPEWRLLYGTGFCGGYTTFSTFAYETLILVEARSYLLAAVNVAANTMFCLLAVIVGFWLARLL